jgi:Protein of unknown function (DUF3237)
MTATPPGLSFMTEVRCEVGELITLGPAPLGERRCVAILGGSVVGPELNGSIVPGGADWQWNRSDGALEISAHYMLKTADGALIEVHSNGLRHGPPEVLARLARGEDVAAHEYFFRTALRFTTGAPAHAHLNKTMGVAVGRREARRVVLDFWRLG